jgi:hypothetical protein
LITLSDCGDYIVSLPTIQQCLDYVNPNFNEDGLNEYLSRYGSYANNILNTKWVLPIRSDPTKTDTDGDGLKDCEERKVGTDPFHVDTDRDGIWDGDDVFPLVPNVSPNVFWRTRQNANFVLDKKANDWYVNNTNYDVPLTSFIYGQNNSQGVGNMTFGGSSVANTGCGSISIYNAIKALGKTRFLSDIIYEFGLNPFSKTASILTSFIPWNGFLGASPGGIESYLIHHGFKIEGTWNLNEFASWGEKEDRIFIILYWNDISDITSGAHYVMIKSDANGTYTTYNMFGRDEWERHDQDLFENILKNGDRERMFVCGWYIPIVKG